MLSTLLETADCALRVFENRAMSQFNRSATIWPSENNKSEVIRAILWEDSRKEQSEVIRATLWEDSLCRAKSAERVNRVDEQE